MKAEIKESLGTLRLHRRSRLRSKLLLADPTRKKFWRFLKGQIKAAGQISALTNKEKKMVFEQHEVEDAALDHFATIFQGQRVPIYLQDDKIDQIELTLLELDQILGDSPTKFEPAQFEQEVCSNYSLHELCQIVANLPSGKASGYDSIPNELLKNCSQHFKQYLLAFLNQIIKDGKVPPEINIGKCMLIHKVTKLSLYSQFNLKIQQGGDSLSPAQYRPITIPSNILRLLTVRMCAGMTEAAESNGLLGPEQFGFRRGRSTVDAVFVLSTLLKKAKSKR